MNILDKIIANKRVEVARHREAVSPGELMRSEHMARKVISMSRALQESPTGIISEFKRKSPSRGWIHPEADPSKIIPEYQAAGAAAVSVLTDEMFFGGTLNDIKAVRDMISIPILRKEFIIDEYQLCEAKAAGADAVLLIASALNINTCKHLISKAHSLGLEVLLELHGEDELEYGALDADMIGINNRNLTTFVTDVAHSAAMIPQLSAGKVYISESGISSPETVRELRGKGFRGFLMGENFMKHPQPGEELKAFIGQLNA